MMRSMMSYLDLPKLIWGYTLETTTYILNLILTKSIQNTFIKLWTDHKVSIQHNRIWRCPAYVFKGKTKKLDTKSELCYFIKYPKGTKG